ncbi:GAF domain-containing protein [Rhodobacteraceae bacterium W635]|uniref:IclR family transcriptional regulator n=1 Tax=Nioella halotolerans TaxID=2303578 RepID=UPI000E3DB6BB|nr:GAF domain-containing protein [Rhodobacteraceae bacterium W635]
MSKGRIDAVERAMSILSAFSSQRRRMTLTELAEETGLHKSSVLRQANSMLLYGFLIRDAEGRYGIGASVWRLGLIFRQDYQNGVTIRPVLRNLVARTGETASFYVRAGEDRVCLYRENSPNLIRYHLDEGMRLPMDRGSVAMVLRRCAGEDVPADIAFTPAGSVDMAGGRNPNIASVATPVIAPGGDLLGALAVSGLTTRFTPDKRAQALQLIEQHAATLRQTSPATP